MLNCTPISGVIEVGGTTWYFDFGPMFGPLFTTKRGVPLAKQPDERSPVWGPFYDWYEREIGPLEWRQAEREQKAIIEAFKRGEPLPPGVKVTRGRLRRY